MFTIIPRNAGAPFDFRFSGRSFCVRTANVPRTVIVIVHGKISVTDREPLIYIIRFMLQLQLGSDKNT
jgi:hypothetical protein